MDEPKKRKGNPETALRNQFMAYQCHISDTFTTMEARAWYKTYRKTGFYSNLYMMILQPLAKEGRIVRVARGLWRILNQKEEQSNLKGLDTQWQEAVSVPRSETEKTRQMILRDLDPDDEFEAYIASKLKQGV